MGVRDLGCGDTMQICLSVAGKIQNCMDGSEIIWENPS